MIRFVLLAEIDAKTEAAAQEILDTYRDQQAMAGNDEKITIFRASGEDVRGAIWRFGADESAPRARGE